MTITELIYYCIYLSFLLPVFLICLLGWPLFIVKLISKIIHYKEPFKQTKVFSMLLSGLSLFAAYYLFTIRNHSKKIQSYLDKEETTSSYTDLEIKRLFGEERNLYLYLTCIALLFAIYKLTHRMINIADMKRQIKAKKEELSKKGGDKPLDAKKKD